MIVIHLKKQHMTVKITDELAKVTVQWHRIHHLETVLNWLSPQRQNSQRGRAIHWWCRVRLLKLLRLLRGNRTPENLGNVPPISLRSLSKPEQFHMPFYILDIPPSLSWAVLLSLEALQGLPSPAPDQLLDPCTFSESGKMKTDPEGYMLWLAAGYKLPRGLWRYQYLWKNPWPGQSSATRFRRNR